jgi:ribonuclease HII
MTGKKIKEIQEELKVTKTEDLQAFLDAYASDERPGDQKLVAQANKRVEKLRAEIARMENLKFFERKYGDVFHVICGIDEAGRGPLAGPVVAGAVVFPADTDITGIND